MLTSILRGLSSAPAPLFLNNLYPSLFIEMKALNLEIHHGISSRLRFRDPSACLRVGKIENFCFVSQEKCRKKRNFIPWFVTPRGKKEWGRTGEIRSLENESFVSLDLCASFERLTAHRLCNFDPDPNVYFLVFLPQFFSLPCFTLELFLCS